MLVLSRKRYETVVINVGGVLIEVTVVDIQNGRVRVGFEAPREVAIHRKEIFEEMEKERERAKGDGR